MFVYGQRFGKALHPWDPPPSQKIFDFILSRRGDSVLFVDELIAFANVRTPMDFGFIIVDHHGLLSANHWYDTGKNYLYIIGC